MFPSLNSIKPRRQAVGITQRRLAELAVTTQSYMNKIERGRAIPNYVLAGRIFQALEKEEHRGEKTVREVMHSPV
ncbi:MAG: helix-turn-helix domain-containing protein, partial [Nitrososphaerales archaeon]